MMSTPTSAAVYRLICELTDASSEDNDNGVTKEEREDPMSPDNEPTGDLEDVEHRGAEDIEHRGANIIDASTRFGDYVQRKRTTITPSQKAILEGFYASGMISSGMQHSALHDAAALKTGLSVQNVQHWIRNRRRPIRIRKVKSVRDDHRSIDNSQSTATNANLTAAADDDSASPLYLSPDPSRSSYYMNNLSSAGSQLSDTSPTAIMVKCRIADSSELDFVEVELPSLTYASLLQSCCDEMEVELTAVAKIRKLPNILVRKDKDVMRLCSLQELELVLHP